MNPLSLRAAAGVCLAGLMLTSHAAAQAVTEDSTVAAVKPAKFPLPAERDSANVTRFSFIVYGDTRGRRDGVDLQYEHSLVVESMLRRIAAARNGDDPIRFVLQTGDAVVNGRDPKQWNRSFVGLINRITTEAGLPYFLAAGNHDVTGNADLAAAGRVQGLRNYLAATQHLIPTNLSRTLPGYPTFAFGYGNTFVLALDSNIAEDSTQLAWATQQLQGLDRKRWQHIVAMFHQPVYSSGPHGGTTVERATAAVRARWMPLFRRHGVELIFVGHEHFFEHWVERYRDANGNARRIDQIVTGGGGAPLYTYAGEPDLRAYRTEAGRDSVQLTHLVKPGMNSGENPYHYVIVHVDGPELWLEVVGIDWGASFQPYRSARTTLTDPAKR